MLSIEATDPHKEYQQELLEFLKEATKENSVIYEFKFTNKYCYCKTVKYEIDGSKETLDDKTFSNPKEVLLEIIEPFLKEFANQNEIVINQILPKSNSGGYLYYRKGFPDDLSLFPRAFFLRLI